VGPSRVDTAKVLQLALAEIAMQLDQQREVVVPQCETRTGRITERGNPEARTDRRSQRSPGALGRLLDQVVEVRRQAEVDEALGDQGAEHALPI